MIIIIIIVGYITTHNISECSKFAQKEYKTKLCREGDQRVGFLARKKEGDFRLLAEALWRGRWKSQHRKIVPLTPYVEKTQR